MVEDVHSAPTLFLLMAQYEGRTIIPIEEVCRDFFGHLTVEKRYVVTSHCRSFGLS
jgi:hypothetical protein